MRLALHLDNFHFVCCRKSFWLVTNFTRLFRNNKKKTTKKMSFGNSTNFFYSIPTQS